MEHFICLSHVIESATAISVILFLADILFFIYFIILAIKHVVFSSKGDFNNAPLNWGRAISIYQQKELDHIVMLHSLAINILPTLFAFSTVENF